MPYFPMGRSGKEGDRPQECRKVTNHLNADRPKAQEAIELQCHKRYPMMGPGSDVLAVDLTNDGGRDGNRKALDT